MRTTITLYPDVNAAVRRLMRERGLTLKEAVNEAIRRGLTPGGGRDAFSTPVFDMGTPAIPLDKAMRLAAELEDEEIRRKSALRK